MTVTVDRIERISNYIILGKTKDEFPGDLTAEESALWDEFATEVADMKAAGITPEPISEWRTP